MTGNKRIYKHFFCSDCCSLLHCTCKLSYSKTRWWLSHVCSSKNPKTPNNGDLLWVPKNSWDLDRMAVIQKAPPPNVCKWIRRKRRCSWWGWYHFHQTTLPLAYVSVHGGTDMGLRPETYRIWLHDGKFLGYINLRMVLFLRPSTHAAIACAFLKKKAYSCYGGSSKTLGYPCAWLRCLRNTDS